MNEGTIYNSAMDLLIRSVDASMTPAYVAQRVRKALTDFEKGLAYGALELRSWSALKCEKCSGAHDARYCEPVRVS